MYVVLGNSHISLLLFPEEEDTEILHQRYKHVGNILQHFYAFLQGIEELPFGVYDLRGYQGSDHATSD